MLFFSNNQIINLKIKYWPQKNEKEATFPIIFSPLTDNPPLSGLPWHYLNMILHLNHFWNRNEVPWSLYKSRFRYVHRRRWGLPLSYPRTEGHTRYLKPFWESCFKFRFCIASSFFEISFRQMDCITHLLGQYNSAELICSERLFLSNIFFQIWNQSDLVRMTQPLYQAKQATPTYIFTQCSICRFWTIIVSLSSITCNL